MAHCNGLIGFDVLAIFYSPTLVAQQKRKKNRWKIRNYI